jgi:hypothetical protein
MPTPPVPSKTRAQIAAEYQVSPSTLRRRINKARLAIPAGTIFPAYQRLLYERLGYPGGVDSADYAEIPLPEDTKKKPVAAIAHYLRPLRNHSLRS